MIASVLALWMTCAAWGDVVADPGAADTKRVKASVTISDLRSQRFKAQVESAKVDPKVSVFVAVDPAGGCGKPKLVVFERRGADLVKTREFEPAVGEKGRETPEGFFPGAQDFRLNRAYRRPVKTGDYLYNFVGFSRVHGICSDRGIVDGRFVNGGLVVLKDADSKIVYDLFAANPGRVKLLVENGSTAAMFPKEDYDLVASL